MSLRKVAALLAAVGLMVGLIGSGVGANFTDQVTAIQNINVGTFSCTINASGTGVVLGDYVNGYPHSVTYTDPTTINSSAPSSAPFSFTVNNMGSIDAVLNITASGLSDPFSIIGSPFTPVTLPAGDNTVIGTGIQWGPLNNGNLGQSVTATWTVNCDEQNATTGSVIFDNTPPRVLPPNIPSAGVESYYFNEWGAGVTFAGTARHLATATVTMSSWACESGSWTGSPSPCVSTPGDTYSVPITFNVYSVGGGNSVGSVIATVTQTFAIPYRPSADATHCPSTPNEWWNGTVCKNGLAHDITFTFSGQALPATAIFGIAYNTSTNGYTPLGHVTGGRPVDSLNIGVYPETTGNGSATVAAPPVVGSWLPNGLSAYVSPDLPSSGTFAGPVTTYQELSPFGQNLPAVQITATN